MVFKIHCTHVLWTKITSALKGLTHSASRELINGQTYSLAMIALDIQVVCHKLKNCAIMLIIVSYVAPITSNRICFLVNLLIPTVAQNALLFWGCHSNKSTITKIFQKELFYRIQF